MSSDITDIFIVVLRDYADKSRIGGYIQFIAVSPSGDIPVGNEAVMIHIGGGVGIFFSPKFALDLGLTFMSGSLTEVELAGETEDVDLDLTSTRFDIGATWFLGGAN